MSHIDTPAVPAYESPRLARVLKSVPLTGKRTLIACLVLAAAVLLFHLVLYGLNVQQYDDAGPDRDHCEHLARIHERALEQARIYDSYKQTDKYRYEVAQGLWDVMDDPSYDYMDPYSGRPSGYVDPGCALLAEEPDFQADMSRLWGTWSIPVLFLMGAFFVPLTSRRLGRSLDANALAAYTAAVALSEQEAKRQRAIADQAAQDRLYVILEVVNTPLFGRLGDTVTLRIANLDDELTGQSEVTLPVRNVDWSQGVGLRTIQFTGATVDELGNQALVSTPDRPSWAKYQRPLRLTDLLDATHLESSWRD